MHPQGLTDQWSAYFELSRISAPSFPPNSSRNSLHFSKLQLFSLSLHRTKRQQEGKFGPIYKSKHNRLNYFNERVVVITESMAETKEPNEGYNHLKTGLNGPLILGLQ